MTNIDVQMKKDIFIFDPDDVQFSESNLDQINDNDEDDSNTSLDLSDKCSNDDYDDDDIPNQNNDLSIEEGSIQFINDDTSTASMNASSIQTDNSTNNDFQVNNQSN